MPSRLIEIEKMIFIGLSDHLDRFNPMFIGDQGKMKLML